tara:strand:- start:38 stop:244 length:207 start_codon:yes stop_codon:yes gene_type:complete
MLEEYKRNYDGDETTEFVYESEEYDIMNPMEKGMRNKDLITIGLWTIIGIIFTIFVSSPVVFHYWINH